jgi:Nif-specific regulatory protein
MRDESLKGTLNSRYTVRKALGEFPPWQSYSVSDTLSEKNYLFFSLDVPAHVSISIEDCRMRDFLFSRSAGPAEPALSLQKSDGAIAFLLPYAELVPLTKALPSMKPGKASSIIGTIVAYVIERLREGLSFGNLSLESICLVDSAPVILPTAYLLPGEISDRMLANDCAKEHPRQAPYEDLRALGAMFTVCSQYLDQDSSERARRLETELRSLTPSTPTKVFDAVIEELVSFAGSRAAGGLAPAFRPSRYDAPAAALKAIKQCAAEARNGKKELVILRGKPGEGRTRFVQSLRKTLVEEWGFECGTIAGDLALFQDASDKEAAEGIDFALVDDSGTETLLDAFRVDYLCQIMERCNLAVIAASAEEPLIRTLCEEFSRREIAATTVELPGPSAAEKKRALSDLLPHGGTRRVDESLGKGVPFAVARLNVLAGTQRRSPAQSEETGLPCIDAIEAEDRSLLGLLAAFGFEAPLSLLLDIYRPEENGVFVSLQRLVALGFLRFHAEVSSLSRGELCLVYGLSSKSLAHAVLATMPKDRRESIHRNIAHLLKGIGAVPSAYTFYHLARSGAREEAALVGLEILELFMRRKRLAALACFNAAFISEKLDRALPIEARFRLYLELGNHFSITGSMERAEYFFRQCREEIGREEEPTVFRALAVEAARKESEILEKKGEFLKAEKLLEKALDTHGDHLLSSERAKLYNDMAWIHYRLGAFDRSWEYCLLVHRILDEKQNPAEIAQAYNLMGTINWNRSKYEDAILCHKRCLALREECNDEIGVATSYNNLGLVHRSLGSLAEARECFQKSMEIKKRHENLPGLAVAHLNLALVYLDMEKLKDAERSCVTAVKLAEAIGNQQLLAEAYGTLGEIHHLQGNYEKANGCYAKDLRLCDKTKSLRERAVVYRKLGELNFAAGRLPETLELLDDARALNQRIGSRLETSLLNLLEGRICIAQGKLDDGRRKLEGVCLELSLLGKKNASAAVAAEIGALYLGEGNESLAREYLLRATSLVAEGEKPPEQVRTLQESLDARSPLSLDQIVSDADRFRALCRVTSLMRTTRDGDSLRAAITETARRITGMDRAALFVRGEGTEAVRIVSASGGFTAGSVLTDRPILAVLSIAQQLGYALDVSRTSIPEGKVASEFLKEHTRIVCIPLRIREEPTGFLYLDSTRPSERTSDDDHSLMVAFGQEASLALERLLLSEKIDNLEKPHVQGKPAPMRTKERITFQDLIGNSAAMKHIYGLIDGIKDLDTTVLLTGSNGTGKDMIAKTIHFSGARADKLFVALNCSAIPGELLESELFGHERGAFTGAHRQRTGHFESANGGTIFLNEIGDMPLHLQPKLLHVLEEQKFYRVGGTTTISTNVRIIAATNKDLLGLVKQGTFREDLFYRVNIFPIRVPDLKERTEDIEPLCNHFLSTFCHLYGIPVKKISAEALACLVAYDWPGNVRELENLMNRIIIMSKKETILPEDLPDYVVKRPESARAEAHATIEETIDSLLATVELSTSDPILPKIEGMIVSKVVEKIGDKTKAAAILGISKPTVYSKLKKHGKGKNA